MRTRVVPMGWALTLLQLSPVIAGVTWSGKAFDGLASTEAIAEARTRQEKYDPAMKLPLASAALQLELFAAAGERKTLKTWSVTTDEAGAFSFDTGLDAWPPGALVVARAEIGGRQAFSAFLRPAASSQDLHLYPTTDDSRYIQADLNVVYDVHTEKGEKSLRVRLRVSLTNAGGEMYIGRKTVSPMRELWRVPLPEGAVITTNTGPIPGVPGWRVSVDGRWLVIDEPVPGLLDFQSQGAHEVHYLVPPRQSFFQSYPIPIAAEKQRVAFWSQHGAMGLESAQVPIMNPSSLPDPFAGEGAGQMPGAKTFDVHFRNEPLREGQAVVIALSTDNVPLGQAINAGAFKWVGGFVLVCLVAVLGGLMIGPKGQPPEAVLDSLSGEEVLDRIAALDARFARGGISEREYQRFREPLLELAAEELQGGAAAVAGTAAAALPPEAAEILERIEQLERDGLKDPAKISERAHLLEALARSLRRPRGKG